MYLSFPANQIRAVEASLRELNLYPIETHFPIIGGVLQVRVEDESIAKNIMHQLKHKGTTTTIISTK
jgi:hypothetical protein